MTAGRLMPRRIFLCAGEASGDIHGGNLIAAIRKADPEISFLGIGGIRMRAQGMAVIEDVERMAVMGLTEVVRHIPFFRQTLLKTVRILELERPDLVILIDYPDFNFLLGKEAKRLGIPVFFYISPQLWAWRQGRARILRDFAAMVFVVFPFEVDFYKSWGVPCEFVGHPFVEETRKRVNPEAFIQQWGLSGDQRYVTLMPGSRHGEIHRLLQPMLQTAELLHERIPSTQFLLPLPPNLERELPHYRAALANLRAPVTLIPGDATNALAVSQAALIKSGTSTIEAAIVGTPAVVTYKVSPLSWAIASRLVKVDHIAMVNLIAGERLIPEFLQHDVRPRELAASVATLLTDFRERSRIMEGYSRTIDRLQGSHASERAALRMLFHYRRLNRLSASGRLAA